MFHVEHQLFRTVYCRLHSGIYLNLANNYKIKADFRTYLIIWKFLCIIDSLTATLLYMILISFEEL